MLFSASRVEGDKCHVKRLAEVGVSSNSEKDRHGLLSDEGNAGFGNG